MIPKSIFCFSQQRKQNNEFHQAKQRKDGRNIENMHDLHGHAERSLLEFK